MLSFSSQIALSLSSMVELNKYNSIYGKISLFASSCVSFLFTYFFNDNHVPMITIVITLLMIDTILGSIYAFKEHEFRSCKFKKLLAKAFVYGIIMLIFSAIDKVTGMNVFMMIASVFMISTEGLSILEKLGKLGFPIPKEITKRLKDVKDRPEFSNTSIDKV